jgi:AcrR family transcriptional regulator
MSLPVDDHARTDDITDAITRLIAAGGIQRVTMRAIASDVGISVGALAGHLTNRERILRVCGSRFGRRRLDALGTKGRARGLSAFLPEDAEELLVERVWLAWREIGRDDAGIARTVMKLDAEERFLLSGNANASRTTLSGPSLDALMATLHGLRDALCASAEERMSLERAQIALAAAASALARSSATIVSGSAAE